jgi:transposase
MAFREVTMLEVKEVLLRWKRGEGISPMARGVGVDRKTVRRYLRAAKSIGMLPGPEEISDEQLAAVLVRLKGAREVARGEAWAQCEAERAFVEGTLGRGVKLSKVGKLLARRGHSVPYSTLYRFAVAELGFGRAAPSVPILDCKPGEEVQLDTGWVGTLEPDLFGKRRRFRAWIFTSVCTRHRFVWPCFSETTASAIEACEEAWAFFGGVFRVVIPDNTKAIVQRADPLDPLITPAFLEYAQARGFHIDATRARSPKDKARVERSVPTVRDDSFGGERLQTLEDARRHGRWWCLHDYGMHRHTRTQRLPLEHFEAEEQARLLPKPTARYDVPEWSEPQVARDHFAQVAKALYTLPSRYIGRTVRARADRATVRFYLGAELIKTHARQPPGGKAIDENDFPPEKRPYAMRDVAFLERQARSHGEAVGRFAAALLEGPLPWTRMRRAYALLGLCKRYGDGRVDEACGRALAAQMLDVRRLERMLRLAAPSPAPAPGEPSAKVIPLARHLRPASQYALPLSKAERTTPKPEGDER